MDIKNTIKSFSSYIRFKPTCLGDLTAYVYKYVPSRYIEQLPESVRESLEQSFFEVVLTRSYDLFEFLKPNTEEVFPQKVLDRILADEGLPEPLYQRLMHGYAKNPRGSRYSYPNEPIKPNYSEADLNLVKAGTHGWVSRLNGRKEAVPIDPGEGQTVAEATQRVKCGEGYFRATPDKLVFLAKGKEFENPANRGWELIVPNPPTPNLVEH